MFKPKYYERKGNRYKYYQDCEYSLNNGNRVKADIINISLEGAKLRVLQVLEQCDTLYLYFKEGEQYIQMIKAEVRYVHEHGSIVGVKLFCTEENRKFLSSRVRNLKII
jgi:hypothetical protein